MRIVYFGSGEFGLPTLARLRAEHELAAVVTQPDRPAGRKRLLTPTPVAQWAKRNAIPVLSSADVNTPAFIEQVAQLQPAASVVIAFGQKMSPELIGVMGKLAVNLHASLLPKYRGAAPINWAMINEEEVTGLSVIELAQRMDAGRIYAAAELRIDPNETAGELHDRLAGLGPQVVSEVLEDLEIGTLSPVEQDEALATRAPKLTKADGTVDFNQPAAAVRARIHGLTPWPGCSVNWECQYSEKTQPLILRRVRVDNSSNVTAAPGTIIDGFRVATSSGCIRLLEVQAAGAKALSINDFAHGHSIAPGDTLQPLTSTAE